MLGFIHLLVFLWTLIFSSCEKLRVVACEQQMVCQYDGGGFIEHAQCGALVVVFRGSWKNGKRIPSEHYPDLKELIAKDGATIQMEDYDLGMLSLCYGLDTEELSAKKKQLEKHPAVRRVHYNSVAVPD